MGNKPQRKWTAVAGAVLLCMAVIFIVFFFGEVSTAKFDSVFLFPTPEYETDWLPCRGRGNRGERGRGGASDERAARERRIEVSIFEPANQRLPRWNAFVFGYSRYAGAGR